MTTYATSNSNDAPGSTGDGDVEILSVQTPNLGPLFKSLEISLLVSTYQAGKLIVLRHDEGALSTHFVESDKPMGIAVDKDRIAVGVSGEIQFFANVPENCAKLSPAEKYDACFVNRYSHITGDIDVHEMAFGDNGQIWFINTRFSSLCTLHGSPSFVPVWRPKFVSAYAPEDRCHLNGLCMMNGQPRYVTALGVGDHPTAWRDKKANGGVLIDLADGRILAEGLSMPHSPRWYANQLWVCESGKGTLSKVDYITGQVTPFFRFPGFTRGLDFYGPLAFVGLSQIRETAIFSGIPIAEKAKERNCGIWIINILDGSLVGMLRFTQGVEEIFSVQVLQGLKFPEVLERNAPLSRETYFFPPEVIKEVKFSPVVERVYGNESSGSSRPRVKSGPLPDRRYDKS